MIKLNQLRVETTPMTMVHTFIYLSAEIVNKWDKTLSHNSSVTFLCLSPLVRTGHASREIFTLSTSAWP